MSTRRLVTTYRVVNQLRTDRTDSHTRSTTATTKMAYTTGLWWRSFVMANDARPTMMGTSTTGMAMRRQCGRMLRTTSSSSSRMLSGKAISAHLSYVGHVTDQERVLGARRVSDQQPTVVIDAACIAPHKNS